MKKLACLLVAAALFAVAAAADVSGKWSGTFSPESGDQSSAYLVLKQSGSTVTGTAGPDADTQWTIKEGKIDGNKLTIEVTNPDDNTVYKCTLTLDPHHMTGDVEATMQGQTIKGKLDVTKID